MTMSNIGHGRILSDGLKDKGMMNMSIEQADEWINKNYYEIFDQWDKWNPGRRREKRVRLRIDLK